ncbi:MAG TPA: sensor histidine kinase, partial [Aquificaceae bacterium]|nr:sensor histidine kinase [Aquificaceae bacterium]
LAYQSFTIYLHNKEYKGDERVVINPFPEELYRVYVFDNPLDPFKSVKVGIKKEYLNERINQLMKRLLIVEFFLVLALVFLYQTVVEGYIKRLKEKEEWIKRLMLALTHRLGNFISTQKVLIALLKKSYPEDRNIQRIEKSVLKAQRDFSIFTNLARENIKLEKDFLNVKELILESLSYFDEELKRKRLILHLKDMQVFMNRADLDDVLYNLISNAIKHSKSMVHIKICPKVGALIIRNDVSHVENSGMGLGFELTKEVVKRYGFSLNVRIKKGYTVFLSFAKR